jgi:hypothetical protein
VRGHATLEASSYEVTRLLQPGRPSGDTEVPGRRVTSKAPSAHVEGGSGRSEASPTAVLQDTHSVEGVSSEVRRSRPTVVEKAELAQS